jgi:hypothetical protein
MGWHINLVKNTVKITSEIALALYNCEADVCCAWQDECSFPMLEGVIYDGKLVFNPDHMEHMDYLHEGQVQRVLKCFKVKGDVCFSSDDGDNRGQSWGYRFDGEGGMTLLKGSREFSESGKGKPRKASKKGTAKPKKAKKDRMEGVRACIESEGFDYAFRHYSSFDDVKDKNFHALREAYVRAAQALEDYVGEV